MKVLVDTNVLSEAHRPKGHPAVRARLAAMANDDLFISVISIGEIAHGIARLEASNRRRDLEEWLAQTERYFADRVLSIDRDIAQVWGELTAMTAKAGRMINAPDGLIAATALRHGLRLMTRNTGDFEATGVLVINPTES